MHYLVYAIVLWIVLFVDPKVYMPHKAPKEFALIVLVSLALLAYCIHGKMRNSLSIKISVIEVLLLIRLVWIAVASPDLIKRPSNLEFWIITSLVLLSVYARQFSGTNEIALGNGVAPKGVYILFFRSLWIIGIVQALYGLYQLLIFGGVRSPFLKTPIVGTIGMANGFGTFMSVSILALMSDFSKVKTVYGRTILSLCGLIMMTALVLNGSRGALLALVVSSILIASVFILSKQRGLEFFNKRSVVRLKSLRTILLSVIACSICISLTAFTAFLYQLNPESSAGRFFVWKISIPMFIQNPVWGLGSGQFAVQFLNYQAQFFRDPEHLRMAHKAANFKWALNDYIQSFCETGTLGGILFLAIWASAFCNAFKCIRKGRHSKSQVLCLTAILTAVFFHSFVDSPMQVLPIATVIYVAFGLVPATPYEWTVKRKVALDFLLLLTLVYFGWVVTRMSQQYEGYIKWQDGLIYKERSMWTDATSSYREALKRLPDKGELQFHLGAALSVTGDYVGANELLKKSLNSFSDKNIYLFLSYNNIRLKDYPMAENYAKAALARFPEHLTPHLLLGEIYYRQGKPGQSRVALLECINRENRFSSPEVNQVVAAAKNLWKEFYGQQDWPSMTEESGKLFRKAEFFR